MATRKNATRKPAAQKADTNPVAHEPHENAAEAFDAAFRSAIDERDTVTGVIAAIHLDSVRVTYSALDKRTRERHARDLSSEYAEKVLASDDDVDTSLAVALATISSTLAAVNRANVKRTAEPYDPVPALTGLYAALNAALADVEDVIADIPYGKARSQAIELGKPGVEAESATASGVQYTVSIPLATMIARAKNGRRRGPTGPRRPGRDVATLVSEHVAAHGVTSLGNLSRALDVSNGALSNRYRADNIPGVSATVDSNGRKAFGPSA